VAVVSVWLLWVPQSETQLVALCGFSQVRLCLTGLWEVGETHGAAREGVRRGPMCLTLRNAGMARTCVAGMAGTCVVGMAGACVVGMAGTCVAEGGERMDVKRKLGKCFAGWMEKSNFASRLLSTFE